MLCSSNKEIWKYPWLHKANIDFFFFYILAKFDLYYLGTSPSGDSGRQVPSIYHLNMYGFQGHQVREERTQKSWTGF